MQVIVAEPLAQRPGLGGRAVVAVDDAGPQRLAPAADRHDRRALAGEPDGQDRAARPELADQRTERGKGGPPPGRGVLLGPLVAGDRRREGAADLAGRPALQAERGSAGAGRADVHGDEHLAGVSGRRLDVHGHGGQPRTSWWALILSLSRVISAPFSAPVE